MNPRLAPDSRARRAHHAGRSVRRNLGIEDGALGEDDPTASASSARWPRLPIATSDRHAGRSADTLSCVQRQEVCLIGTTTASAAPSAEEIGKSFATEWASKATENEKLELLGQAPRIPPALDAQLIRHAKGVLGSISDGDRERIRRALRAGFWAALRAT